MPLEERVHEGLDARYAVDLATLEADGLVLPAERFYLRTAAPEDLGDPAAWEVRLTGLVEAEVVVAIDEILAEVRPIGVVHWECSGNAEGAAFGLMAAGDFAGAPLAVLLAKVRPVDGAVAVRITGRDGHPPSERSEPGASWVFRPDELDGAWLVTHQDGAPLAPDHGHPVRLLVPGWYGCCDVKWVDEIAWVGEDEPATSQMLEFAARTDQDGVPPLARDYAPAEIGVSAVVARVEEWDADGERVLVAVGVVWGGQRPTEELRLWLDDEDLGPVRICRRDDVATWGLWASALPSSAKGEAVLRLTSDGDDPAPRLASRYYPRRFDLG